VAGDEGKCSGRWWRRLSDGLLLREAPRHCPWQGGGSLWGEFEVPAAGESLALTADGSGGALTLTVELERRGKPLFVQLSNGTGDADQ
ncbi:unnamed protein product, partial [Polarella glacialis]